jgi:hypothetical protein
MNEPSKNWPGFKYEPVPGLSERHVARFLRTQRKNMRRVFAAKGAMDLAAQLDALRRDPTRDGTQKNQAFQRILNEHITRATPQPAAKADDPQAEGHAGLGLHVPGTTGQPDQGAGTDTGGGVLGLAERDQPATEPVIEE